MKIRVTSQYLVHREPYGTHYRLDYAFYLKVGHPFWVSNSFSSIYFSIEPPAWLLNSAIDNLLKKIRHKDPMQIGHGIDLPRIDNVENVWTSFIETNTFTPGELVFESSLSRPTELPGLIVPNYERGVPYGI